MSDNTYLKSIVLFTEEIFGKLTEGLPLGDAATARLARRLPTEYVIEEITFDNSPR